MSQSLEKVLSKIHSVKKKEVEILKKKPSQFFDRKGTLPSGFKQFSKSQNLKVIAELKKASPSEGLIRSDFDVLSLAKDYVENGADFLSVLTDVQFFQGDPKFLEILHSEKSIAVPLLRKDFFIDPLQIDQSYSLGADGILLIVALLPKNELKRLYLHAQQLGLFILTEVHTQQELQIALDLGVEMIGVNNRNLDTFQVDLKTSLDLAPQIPQGVYKVSESGIHSGKEMQVLQNAGFDAVLIGTDFMRSPSPGKRLKQMKQELQAQF